jgi:cytochrome P450 family 26 subfamily A
MQFFDEAISRRRNREEWHDDFLQSMLRDRDCPENERVTDIQLKDNLLTLILAGQTTTAAAMMWAVKYLDENPDVQEKLRLEQLRIKQSKTAGSSLTLEDVNKMTNVSKVVKEVLRLSSIVSWIPRVALNDCILNDFNVKKGWTVNIDARFMHFDPSLYNQPTEFNPARFTENPQPYSFLAFGVGARTCLGMSFAKLMMKLFLHHLVTSYRWKVEDHDPGLEPWSHFPRLKSGCPITVKPI